MEKKKESSTQSQPKNRVWSPEEINKKHREGKSGALSFGLDRRFYNASLTNWDAWDEHREMVLAWMQKNKYYLIFLGITGVGKTHLCASLLNYYWDAGKEVRFLRGNDFFEKIHDAIQKGQNQYFVIDKYAESEYLIIDDIGSNKNNDWQQTMLYELFDRRSNSMKPTVVTSNFNWEQIRSSLGDRTFSRLASKENFKIERWDKDNRRE
jgi:DNA replication protein DnaC